MPRAGKPEPRTGDEIVAAGQMFHTGARVVLWMDSGGYDAYRVERRFSPYNKSDWTDTTQEVKTMKFRARILDKQKQPKIEAVK